MTQEEMTKPQELAYLNREISIALVRIAELMPQTPELLSSLAAVTMSMGFFCKEMGLQQLKNSGKH